MSNKFSIVDRINLDKISVEIEKYRRYTNEDPYIFMSKETADTMFYDIDPQYASKFYKQSDLIGKFEGHKVFVDNTLSYGMIEIR